MTSHQKIYYKALNKEHRKNLKELKKFAEKMDGNSVNFKIPENESKKIGISFIREMKNARKIYMKKPFIQRSKIVKDEINKRLKAAQDRHFIKASEPYRKMSRSERRFMTNKENKT